MAQNRHWEQDKEATVYIGNIDERAPPAVIYEILLQMAPICNIHMPRDRVSQNHQGFGFVEFRTPADADYAAAVLNGIKVYGKSLRVNKASADKMRAAEVGAELFVGNLDPMVDEKVLYDTFSRFGPLLVPPKVAREESGASKGFGFVSFADFESSDAAIENMNGQYMLSKEVSVQYAFKRDGKGEKHGDEAERELARQAKKHNIVPEAQAMPAAFLTPRVPVAPPPGAPVVPAGFDPSMLQQQPPQQYPPQQYPRHHQQRFQHQGHPHQGHHQQAGGMPMGGSPGMSPAMQPQGFGSLPARGAPQFGRNGSGGGSPALGGMGPPPGMRAGGDGGSPAGVGNLSLPPPPSGLPTRPPPGRGGPANPPAKLPAGSTPAGYPMALPPGFSGSPPPGTEGLPPPGFAPPPGFHNPPPPPPVGFGEAK